MNSLDKIGLVGGGQMAEALIRGILEAEVVQKKDVMVVEPDGNRRIYLRKTYSVQVAEDPAELTGACRLLVLAVKPQIMGKVLEQYRELVTRDHLVISIAAGITIGMVEKGLGGDAKVIRVMPNTPALVLAGASALSPNGNVSPDEMELAMQIFSAVGSCVQVNESLIDAVTGLSGSGPGYVFTFIEAMIDGGVLAGLPRPVAEKLVLQTVYGSAKMAMETGEPPAVLKSRVTSPGGTTITGLQVLEESGFRGAVMSAIEAATERSKELGE